MARQKQDPYETDKEKRDLTAARAADVRSRTSSREDNSYFKARGFPDRPTMAEAETSRERAATNDRLTKNADTNTQIEALKAMAALDPGGPHGKAALDQLAKHAGVTVPKTVDPKQAALDKVRAAKGLPPQGGQAEASQPGTTEGLVAPQQPQNQSIFQPDFNGGGGEPTPAPGTQPVPSRIEGEASLGNPITPHLGVGGALMTPENPTGNPANPWGAGGLFQNPTHEAAQNVQAREAAVHPYGSDNSPQAITHPAGSATDRLMGGSAPQPPNRLPPSPGLVAPPLTNYTPSTPAFDQSKLVQPAPPGPRTPPNINVDLDALASHIGNWFSSQAQQVKQRTNY